MNGSMIPEDLEESIQKYLNPNGDVSITSSTPLSGGSINNTLQFELSNGSRYFLKYNIDKMHPGMFNAEASGLKLLKNTNTVNVPEVIHTGKAGIYSYLILELIVQGSISKKFFTDLGQQMALLHRTTQVEFGLDHDNYIGSLPQLNTPSRTFTDFFISHRLQPLIARAVKLNQMPVLIQSSFEKLFEKLDELMPTEDPALLHGDLWNGNRIIGPDGNAWLIDPAVYFGHRESDIAMSLLFGGFDADFYKAYNEEYPLNYGWRERVDLFNLYPLLVHLNLFGSSYLPQIIQTLGKFS